MPVSAEECWRSTLATAGLESFVDYLDKTAAAAGRMRHRDVERWAAAIAKLPASSDAIVELNRAAPRLTVPELSDAEGRATLARLKEFLPWRKGPFELYGHFIDAEWRSDRKWARVLPHLDALDGHHVFDVGSGNGYFCLRALGAGAASATGIDPMPLFVHQFRAIARARSGGLAATVLPLALEDIAAPGAHFDTVFSMGVLYHRRSPLDHLRQLRSLLRPGGQLLVETLVIEGGSDSVLLPAARYARMRNVWFIPSIAALEVWLRRLGYEDIHCCDVTRTTPDEQRSTDWMQFESLSSALRSDDRTLTVEGYPAPQRALVLARAP